jgi:hypothetical protein
MADIVSVRPHIGVRNVAGLEGAASFSENSPLPQHNHHHITYGMIPYDYDFNDFFNLRDYNGFFVYLREIPTGWPHTQHPDPKQQGGGTLTPKVTFHGGVLGVLQPLGHAAHIRLTESAAPIKESNT